MLVPFIHWYVSYRLHNIKQLSYKIFVGAVIVFMIVLIHYLFIPVNLVQFIVLLLFLCQTLCSYLYPRWLVYIVVLFHCLFIPVCLVQFILLSYFFYQTLYSSVYNIHMLLVSGSFDAKTHLWSPVILLVGNCVPASQCFQPHIPKGLYCSLQTVTRHCYHKC